MSLHSPDNTRAARLLVNVAGELVVQGRADDAFAAAAGAVALDGQLPAAWNAMAAALSGIDGRERQQLDAAGHAVMLDPEEPSAWHNLSMAETRLYRWDAALKSARRAVELCGETYSPYYPAQAAFVAGLLEHGEAQLAYIELVEREAAKLETSARRIFDAECAVQRAILAARRGDWPTHFAELRRRHGLATNARNPLALAERLGLLWRLDMPAKPRAVIFLEWGFGDQIQFARLVERVKIPGVEHVTVCCSRALVDLMRTLRGVDRVIAHEDLDFSVRGWDAAEIFTGEAILIPVIDLMEYAHKAGLFPLGSWRGPYLARVPAAGVAPIERVEGKIAVTFSWQGDPRQTVDFARRIPFREFAAWASKNRDRYSFHSVQTRFGGYCAPWDGWPEGVPLQDMGQDIKTMADAAAAIAASDVYVGQCGGNLHLAGALGHPAVGLLCKSHDWRWNLAEPLYDFPLVSQTELGDWPSAFDQLNGAILDRLALKASGRAPAIQERE